MKKTSISSGIKLILIAFFGVSVVLPLLTMLMNMTGSDIVKVFTSEQFVNSLKNTVLVSVTSTIISIAIAYLLANAIAKSSIKFKAAFIIFFTLPMLIPSISHGMGLVILFGANGIITNLLGWSGNIYGFNGIVVGSVLYSFPIAFLMILDILRYEDQTPYEAATVLGISKFNQIRSITLPYLKKPMISVLFATFTLIVTDYGVPLMLGRKYTTLPVLMYEEVIGRLDFGKGAVIGTILLIPAILAFVFDMMYQEQVTNSFVIKKIEVGKNKLRDACFYLFCGLITVFVMLPILAFVVLTFMKKYPVDLSLTFNNITKTFNMGGGRYLINSLVIAALVSLVGVCVSYLTAYFTARSKGRLSKILHLISIISLAIPGLVLGLSYVMFFKQSAIYGTIVILILVNLVHFFASPYLMAYNSLGKLNDNLEAVGTTLGINKFYMVKDIFIPQTKLTIIEMAAYFFVNSMITISAVSFLTTVKTAPLSLMITQFEAQMLIECSAFVSLLILTANLLIKAIVHIAKKKYAQE